MLTDLERSYIRTQVQNLSSTDKSFSRLPLSPSNGLLYTGKLASQIKVAKRQNVDFYLMRNANPATMQSQLTMDQKTDKTKRAPVYIKW